MLADSVLGEKGSCKVLSEGSRDLTRILKAGWEWSCETASGGHLGDYCIWARDDWLGQVPAIPVWRSAQREGVSWMKRPLDLLKG